MSQARVCKMIFCGLALTGLLAGCVVPPPFVPPQIPPEIQFVLDDPGQFTFPADLELDPNAAPVEDLDAIAGCWARTFDPRTIDISASDLGVGMPGMARTNVRAIDLWRFDVQPRRAQYTVFLLDEPTGVILLQVMSGTFEVREPGTVAVQFDSFEINDWTSGQMQAVPPEGDVPESLLRFQRAGDRLFWLGSADDAADTDEPWVFQRFDCP